MSKFGQIVPNKKENVPGTKKSYVSIYCGKRHFVGDEPFWIGAVR
jgi:hypothetical protein